jgi:hypothetical protein
MISDGKGAKDLQDWYSEVETDQSVVVGMQWSPVCGVSADGKRSMKNKVSPRLGH